MKRVVQPEILDHLPPNDPEAISSRRDLRRINFLMGNFRWMKGAILELPGDRRRNLIEVGAGDGAFLNRMKNDFDSLHAVDFAPRPDGLPPAVEWRQGDVFSELGGMPAGVGSVLSANLFLHHFNEESLKELGELVRQFDVLCFSEPWRSRISMGEGYALWPFVNRVTQHDMIVSIRAGFVRGELPVLLGLDDNWEILEEISPLGACRLVARQIP